jgi:hypothetical protein
MVTSMGPACAIYLPRVLTKLERRSFLYDFSVIVGSDRWDGSSFSVFTTMTIGGSYKGKPRTIFAGFHLFDVEKDALGLISATFDYKPESELQVGAGCNDRVDHRVLAEVAAWLAERLGGVIDVGDINLPFDHPGRHVKVYYDNGAGSVSSSHVLDATALRAWVKTNHFHMVK